MAIYKVQGPNGEIITIEGPDGANPNDVIAQAQSLYQPKEEKSMADKFMEPFKDVSVSDWAQKSLLAPAMQTLQSVTPFGMLRPDVAAMNLKQGSQNLVGKGQQMAQGAYNIATNPVQSAQSAYNAVTTNPAGVAGEMAKGVLYDPEMLIGSGLGNAIEKGVKSAAPVVSGTVMAPYNVGKGALRGVAFPGGTAENSALLPIRPTYVPHEQVGEFMAGQRPATSLTEVSTAPLVEKNAATRWANAMAPENAQGQKLVPAQNRFWEGVGETLGSGYRTNPLQGMADIAGLATGIGPVGAAIKSVPTVASALLQRATQFEPSFGPARASALQREGRAGLQASMPQTPLLSAPAQQTPAQISQQAAAARIQPVAPTQMPPQAAPMPAPAPRPQPVTPTVAPSTGRNSTLINKEMNILDNQATQLRDEALSAGLKPDSPASIDYRNQLDQMNRRMTALKQEYEAAVKAEKSASKKKAPSNVSQMLTEDTVFNTKAEWEKANLFNTLGGKKPVGGYKEGEHIVRHETPDYSFVPEDLRKHLPEVSIVKRNIKGKRIE